MTPPMRNTLFTLLLAACTGPHAFAQEPKPSLKLLKQFMVGSYSSAAQAARDTSYFNIELEMVRIWLKETDGIWLYVEQATAARKDKPYRQRIYHLTQRDDSTFVSRVCTLDSMHLFMGAYRDIARFGALKPSDARTLPGCDLVLHWRNGSFVGSTHERDCRNAWGRATYATSEVVITENGMVSWDRGYNDAGEQVWGAEKGGYEFVKKPRVRPVRAAADE